MLRLATAVVVDVAQLCVHVYWLPYGNPNPADQKLLNHLQTCIWILMTYLTFGGLVQNFMVVADELKFANSPGGSSTQKCYSVSGRGRQRRLPQLRRD